ncbi:MAG: hypothetical protein H6837_01910 [Planctomycetes bacterium]|nr:hypothetical protein [Planctomycetota bacterium]
MIEDDDEEILLYDTFQGPSSLTFLRRERDCFHSTLEKLDPASGSPWQADEIELLDRLRKRGIFAPSADVERAVQASQTTPQFGFGCLTVELDTRLEHDTILTRVSELVRYLREELPSGPKGIAFRLLTDPGLPRGVEEEPWERLGSLAARLTESLREQGLELHFEAPLAPHAIGSAGEPFFEVFGGNRVVALVEVFSGDGSPEETWSELAAVADLGFDVIVEIATDFPPHFVPSVLSMFETGSCSAIRVRPALFRDGSIGSDALRETVDRGLVAIEALSARLGVAVTRCQPWRGVVHRALMPLAHSLGWSKRMSVGHLDSHGRWHRSSHHAERGAEPEEFATLFPSARGSASMRPMDSRLSSGPVFEGSPACEDCGFAPLCDRYWTAEIDALVATNRVEAAAQLGRYECEARKAILGSLLDSIRAEREVVAPTINLAGRSRAELDKSTGRLRFDYQ